MQITNPCNPLVVASHCLYFCICRFRRVELSAFVYLQKKCKSDKSRLQAEAFEMVVVVESIYIICISKVFAKKLRKVESDKSCL